jgi:uncharacterized surface anchored protein
MDTMTVVLTGNCKDVEDNESLAYAYIKLRRSDTLVYAANSDEAGNFKFNHLRAGRYQIQVDATGYYTKDTTVNFATGEIWKIEVGLSKLNEEMRRRITF